MRKPTTFCRINRQHPLAGDLVGAWLFNRNYADSVTGQPGELTGTPAFTILNGDMSLDLTGADDYIDYNLPQFANKPFTVVAYVRTPANQSDAEHTLPVIVSQGDTGAGEWMFRIANSAYPGLYGDAGSMDTPLSGSTVSYSTDYWLQARLMDNDCQTRINNVFCNQDTTVTMSNFSTTKPLRIGNADGASNRFWGGHIHEVYIFSRFLTIPEMQRLQDDSAYRYGLFDKPRDVNFAFASIPDDHHLVPVKVPWTSQPPAGTPIDYTNPLATGLIQFFMVNRDGELVDAVRNKHWPIEISGDYDYCYDPTFRCRALRRFSDATATHYARVNADLSDELWREALWPELTHNYFIRLASGQSTSWDTIISNGEMNGNGRLHQFALDQTLELVIGIHDAAWNASTNFSTDVDNEVLLDDVMHAYGTAWSKDLNSGKGTMYRDGLSLGDSTATQTGVCDMSQSSFYNSLMFFTSRADGGSAGYSQEGAFGALTIHSRKLSTAEMQSFQKNPWQVFEPRTVMLPFEEALPDLAMFEVEK